MKGGENVRSFQRVALFIVMLFVGTAEGEILWISVDTNFIYIYHGLLNQQTATSLFHNCVKMSCSETSDPLTAKAHQSEWLDYLVNHTYLF